MAKTSELIKALQEHMERNGDLNVYIEVQDSSMTRYPHEVEVARINPDHWGNIVTHAGCCTIRAHLEKGCKITAPKALKESRLTIDHKWEGA